MVAMLLLGFARKKETADERVRVARGEVAIETLLTGVVKPAHAVSLSFEKSGTIRTYPKVAGIFFKAGAVIAALQNASEQASLASARAKEAEARAHYDEISRGTRPEEMNVSYAKAAAEEITLKNLREKTGGVIAQSYDNVEKAVNRYIDPLFSNDNTNAPRLSFNSGTQAAYDSESARLVAGYRLIHLKTLLTSTDDEEALLNAALLDLNAIRALFLTLDEVVRTPTGLSEATGADYQERVSTGRELSVAALTLVQDHLHALRESEAAVVTSTQELALKEAGSSSEALRAEAEKVKQAEAETQGAVATLEKTLIRAPFDGVVASRLKDTGESVGSSEAVLIFQGTIGFLIEAEVPEADVTKLAVGALATVTLDAFGPENLFSARVSEIEQGERVIEGVSAYKTTLVFMGENKNLPRSGLTANISIVTAKKSGVLVVPARMIQRMGEKNVVTVLLSSKEKAEREVVIGLRGSDGTTEIESGLAEGEELLAPTP